MSRPIEIRLADEQCDALKAEADAAGVRFFDHCRAKLLAGLTTKPRHVEVKEVPPGPVEHASVRRKVSEPEAIADDRLARLERAVLNLADMVMPLVLRTPEERQSRQDVTAHDLAIDPDDIVGQALAQAEQQPDGFDRGYAEVPGDGIRHVGARRPQPLTVAAGAPAHLAGLGR